MKTSWSMRLRLPAMMGLVVFIASLGGCGAISYIAHGLAPAGKGKWVPAQNEDMSAGKKILVLVYADENIQYQQGQLARYHTAGAVAEQLQSKLKVEVVDPTAVEKFQTSDLNWTDRHPSQIGWKQYQVDMVLYVELQEFTTEYASEELLKGRIEGNCSLFTAKESGSQAELLWQEMVNAVYPPGTPKVAQSGATQRVRAGTVHLFAENLVKHFYGHHEPD